MRKSWQFLADGCLCSPLAKVFVFVFVIEKLQHFGRLCSAGLCQVFCCCVHVSGFQGLPVVWRKNGVHYFCLFVCKHTHTHTGFLLSHQLPDLNSCPGLLCPIHWISGLSWAESSPLEWWPVAKHTQKTCLKMSEETVNREHAFGCQRLWILACFH